MDQVLPLLVPPSMTKLSGRPVNSILLISKPTGNFGDTSITLDIRVLPKKSLWSASTIRSSVAVEKFSTSVENCDSLEGSNAEASEPPPPCIRRTSSLPTNVVVSDLANCRRFKSNSAITSGSGGASLLAKLMALLESCETALASSTNVPSSSIDRRV